MRDLESGKPRRDTSPSAKREGLYRLQKAGTVELGATLADAFRADAGLMEMLACNQEELPGMLACISKLYLVNGQGMAWGYFEGDCMLGGALCLPPGSRESPAALWDIARSCWKIQRWRAIRLAWNGLRYTFPARMPPQAMHLMFLGVLQGAQGRGIGRKLLAALLRETTWPIVQLEVEEENLVARKAYQDAGFVVHRRFLAGGTPMLVMRWQRSG